MACIEGFTWLSLQRNDLQVMEEGDASGTTTNRSQELRYCLYGEKTEIPNKRPLKPLKNSKEPRNDLNDQTINIDF